MQNFQVIILFNDGEKIVHSVYVSFIEANEIVDTISKEAWTDVADVIIQPMKKRNR